jgi:Tol biopolymer transport system component
MTSIVSPRFSPDGRKVVFSGAGKDGFSNLYILNLIDRRLVQITDDIYRDADPAFTQNGDSIVFSSDRCEHGNTGSLNLFKIAITGGNPVPVTEGKWRDTSPDVSSDGIYFASDREGAFNIYRLNYDGSVNRITSLLTGAYDPRLTADGKSLIFSGYQDQGFNIYRTKLNDTVNIQSDPPGSGKVFWKPERLALSSVKSSVKYDTDYSMDIAQSAIAYDPVYGTMGGLQVALSDILGDNIYYFLLANTA